MYHLTVQNGAAKGATWKIEEGPCLLGRSQECAIRIPNDTAVSRVHCELSVDGPLVSFKQLSERSITLLNGKVVREAEMKAGDTLTVGLTTLLLARIADGSGSQNLAKRDFATRTISEADAIFLGGPKSERVLSARVESLRDLAELFRISNELNQAETPAMLFETLTKTIQARFAPARAWVWLARSGPGREDVELKSLPGYPVAPPTAKIQDFMSRASESCEGALVPIPMADGGTGGICAMLVGPLSAGGHGFGAIALESDGERAAYDEDDLQFFVALCRATAPCVNSVARMLELRQEVAKLRSSVPEFEELVGASPPVEGVRHQIKQAAQSTLNILILGESGTGKELAARMTHVYADFCDGPYVVVNCAAIPAEMLESELFGYKAGAFTGATDTREGLIARADGGTLFLDEVGDMSIPNQARLLRVLETGMYRRLGSDDERRAAFRTVSATNKDIREMIGDGRFRNDLYHRLNGFEITLPALRDHLEDLPELVDHLFKQAMNHGKRPLKGIDASAMDRMKRESWPGNVRQLKNLVERGVAVAQGDYVTEMDLGFFTLGPGDAAVEESLSLIDAEKRHIAHVIAQCNGDATEAARSLGLSRSTFYHKAKKHGIALSSMRDTN